MAPTPSASAPKMSQELALRGGIASQLEGKECLPANPVVLAREMERDPLVGTTGGAEVGSKEPGREGKWSVDQLLLPQPDLLPLSLPKVPSRSTAVVLAP